MDAAKKKALSSAGLAVLRFMLLLVVTLFLAQTRVWGVEAPPQHASGKIAFASASAVGVIAPALAYDASDCRVAADTAGSARFINPLNGTDNCVNCATAMDATLAGRPASALLGNPQPISVLGSNWVTVAGQQDVEGLLLQGGQGARGIVFGANPGANVGHVWNAVNQGGAINFIDAQAGAGGAGNFNLFQTFKFLQTNP
jgi:hypothetical protein